MLLERVERLACRPSPLEDLARRREEEEKQRLAGDLRAREDERRRDAAKAFEREQQEYQRLERREESRPAREEHWRREVRSIIAAAERRRDHHAERMWRSEFAMGMPSNYGLRVGEWLPLERAAAADIAAWEAEYWRRRAAAAGDDAKGSLDGEHLYVLEHGVPRAWRPKPKLPPIPPLFLKAPTPQTGCGFPTPHDNRNSVGGAEMADSSILLEACPEPPPRPPPKPNPWPAYAVKLDRQTRAALPRRKHRPAGTDPGSH